MLSQHDIDMCRTQNQGIHPDARASQYVPEVWNGDGPQDPVTQSMPVEHNDGQQGSVGMCTDDRDVPDISKHTLDSVRVNVEENLKQLCLVHPG